VGAGFAGRGDAEMGITMFTIPYNTTLVIVGAIVLGVVGFVVYGLIRGFGDIFKGEYEGK
jgi:hypothetical protein